MRYDDRAWPVMLRLVDCLRERILDAGVPEPAFIGVLPGASPALDWCGPDCGGQAWVRLVLATPSTEFPTPDGEPTFFIPPQASTFEVGLLRCAPMPQGDILPSADEQFEATRLQLADMRVLRDTIQCCFGDTEFLLGSYVPRGPQGGCVGGTWNVTVSSDG